MPVPRFTKDGRRYYPAHENERWALRLSVKAMRRQNLPFRLIASVLGVSVSTAFLYRDVDDEAARRAERPWLDAKAAS
jgi:hypothetical protein